MATSILFFSATPVSNFDSVAYIGIPKSSFPHCSKFYFPASTASTLAITSRRWRFRFPMASAKDSIDRIPKQFREENLTKGLMDNYKNAPEYLYGLSPSKLDMLIGEHNNACRLAESGPEGSIPSHGNYLKHSGKVSVSGMADGGPSKYIMNSMRAKRGMTSRRSKRRSCPAPRDLSSSFLRQRIVFLDCPISPQASEFIISQLMWLDYNDKSKPICLHIMSPGNEDEDKQPLGSEAESYSIADVMGACKSKIYTVNVGKACGQAAMLLSLGAKGRRCVLPCSYTTLYLPELPRSSGSATDIWFLREDLDVNTEIFLELLSKGTGKSKEELHRDLEGRRRRFNAQETIDYGLADRIIGAKGTRT